ncbi:MAG: iron ABC transporter permease [Alphaproteobacteria bacterium]|nr:iron ABC transporter permease [Alphaproteobacteria bacterium]
MNQYFTLRLFDQKIALQLPILALLIFLALFLAIVASLAFSLNAGSYNLSLAEVLDILLGEPADAASEKIVWLFRFPRSLAAILVGMMMALSGAALQNITRNGLADPSLVGISQGAALAVVASIIVFPEISAVWRPWLALLGSLSVAVLIQGLSYEGKVSKPIKFILLGIGVSAFISSITTAMLTYGNIYQASAALGWLAGSINGADWLDVKILAISCFILIPFLLIISRSMAAIRMGEHVAISLGTPILFTRYALISIAVALAAIATSVVGPLGFVGLIAPHAARRLAHCGVAVHLLLTALIGGLLVLIADTAGRAAFAPIQIPAGIVTQIIGVPIFVYLLLRQKAKING